MSLSPINLKKLVVPAGIAGTQVPGMARHLGMHAAWIPAFHAGMTAYFRLSAELIGDEQAREMIFGYFLLVIVPDLLLTFNLH